MKLLFFKIGFCWKIQPWFITWNSALWRNCSVCIAQLRGYQHEPLQIQFDRAQPESICPRTHEYPRTRSLLSRLLGSQNSGKNNNHYCLLLFTNFLRLFRLDCITLGWLLSGLSLNVWPGTASSLSVPELSVVNSGSKWWIPTAKRVATPSQFNPTNKRSYEKDTHGKEAPKQRARLSILQKVLYIKQNKK